MDLTAYNNLKRIITVNKSEKYSILTHDGATVEDLDKEIEGLQPKANEMDEYARDNVPLEHICAYRFFNEYNKTKY